jgi:uncharacterized OB-fold protein
LPSALVRDAEKERTKMSERVPVREDVFIEEADGWKLIGNKCKSCGQIFFPKAKKVCLNCSHEELQDIKLSSRGKLYSYTTVQVPTLHFNPPYAVGYVTLNDKVRIFTQLEEVKDKPFKINMEMELMIDKLWEQGDKDIIGYKFKPV